jgi:hypothetical protein
MWRSYRRGRVSVCVCKLCDFLRCQCRRGSSSIAAWSGWHGPSLCTECGRLCRLLHAWGRAWCAWDACAQAHLGGDRSARVAVCRCEHSLLATGLMRQPGEGIVCVLFFGVVGWMAAAVVACTPPRRGRLRRDEPCALAHPWRHPTRSRRQAPSRVCASRPMYTRWGARGRMPVCNNIT